MDYRIQVGPLAAAYLHAHGIDAWRHMYESDPASHEDNARTAMQPIDGARLILSYLWQPLEHHAELLMTIRGDGWDITDKMMCSPYQGTRIDICLGQVPQSAQMALQHKTLDQIVEAPEWAAPALQDYCAERFHAKNGSCDIFSSFTHQRDFIKVHSPGVEDPYDPEFDYIKRLTRAKAG